MHSKNDYMNHAVACSVNGGFVWQCTRSGIWFLFARIDPKAEIEKKGKKKVSQHSPKTLRAWYRHGMVMDALFICLF
jgi:hypothetical protein